MVLCQPILSTITILYSFDFFQWKFRRERQVSCGLRPTFWFRAIIFDTLFQTLRYHRRMRTTQCTYKSLDINYTQILTKRYEHSNSTCSIAGTLFRSPPGVVVGILVKTTYSMPLAISLFKTLVQCTFPRPLQSVHFYPCKMPK